MRNAQLMIARFPRPGAFIATVFAALVISLPDADAADHVFSKLGPILIPGPAGSAGGTLGNADPYVSSISVGGVPGTVEKVTLTLLNLSHTMPDDINVMLVGPTGASVYIWEDAGGDDAVSGINVSFDDGAAGPIPGEGPLVAGSFQVSQYGRPETFGPPAPATPPFGTNLSEFNGTEPNGTWDLYILDDQARNTGAIAGGWELIIATFVEFALQPGDADQDLDFDQLDLVQLQIAAKYLSGKPATWGEGDWNGAPGGSPGSPPPGDGVFDQLDVVAAMLAGVYLTGPYAAIARDGVAKDGQTSIIYDPTTGKLSVDASAGMELTSINIDSDTGIFTGSAAENLGGSFDNDADGNIFKATFGGSFGSFTFGNVAQTGLDQDFLLGDLTVVGSLQGGGALGDVDLIYIPEPSTAMSLILGSLAVFAAASRSSD